MAEGSLFSGETGSDALLAAPVQHVLAAAFVSAARATTLPSLLCSNSALATAQ
jgi:hypothetical protein